MIPTGQASKFSPPSPPPTPQKMRTNVTSASVTTAQTLIPTTAIKEFKYKPGNTNELRMMMMMMTKMIMMKMTIS